MTSNTEPGSKGEGTMARSAWHLPGAIVLTLLLCLFLYPRTLSAEGGKSKLFGNFTFDKSDVPDALAYGGGVARFVLEPGKPVE